MHRAPLVRITLSASAALLLGCESSRPLEPTRTGPGPKAGAGARVRHPEQAAVTRRGEHEEAYAVQQSGGIIAGYSWQSDGRMIPVKWTLQNGAWTITSLPYCGHRLERAREGRQRPGGRGGQRLARLRAARGALAVDRWVRGARL